MADLTIQAITDEDGAAISFANASAGGDKFKWSEKAVLVVKNDDASAKTVTITPAFTEILDQRYGELTRSSIVLSVAAGAVAMFPPLPIAFRNTADADKVAVTYSAVTSLKVGVIRLP